MNKKILENIRNSGFSLTALTKLCPELNALRDVPQNPEYHAEGDVYKHTEMVCKRLTELSEWQQSDPVEQEMLFLAAAFHDIGKPACTKLEEGKWISPRHTIVGEKEFRKMVYQHAGQFDLTFSQREIVAKLIRHHGLPVISLDDIREELKISPAKGSDKAAHIALERAKVLLRRKEPFIWNATNIIGETRQKLVKLFAGYGARVHILYLEVPYQELLARNRKRARYIPGQVLEKMIRKLEIPEPWEAYEVRYLSAE